MASKNTLAPDIAEALESSGLAATFESLPPSHQREYLKWVDEVKQPQTRTKRIAKMCEMIAAKRS